MAAAVAAVDQAATMGRTPIMDRLFQGIQHDPKGGEANLGRVDKRLEP